MAARAARFQLLTRCACLNGATAGSAVSSQRAASPSTGGKSGQSPDRRGCPPKPPSHAAPAFARPPVIRAKGRCKSDELPTGS